MKKYFPLIVLMILLSFSVTGCKKKKGDPPVLPPKESMAIDFGNFNSGKSGKGFTVGVEDSNWSFAALVAGYFKSLITVTLAVPVASFNYALDQTPTWVEDKTWQWSYSVTVLTVTYKARLVGLIRSTDVLWKMYITKEGTGGFTEWEWFEGTSKLDGTGGQWTLNYSPTYKEPVLQIDWTRSGTSVTAVTYTYVRALNDARAADPFKTSYITYGKTTGTYNSYYTIHYYNGSEFADVNVEWNSTSKIGRVKCSKFFPDSNWHCWDANYTNVNCP